MARRIMAHIFMYFTVYLLICPEIQAVDLIANGLIPDGYISAEDPPQVGDVGSISCLAVQNGKHFCACDADRCLYYGDCCSSVKNQASKSLMYANMPLPSCRNSMHFRTPTSKYKSVYQYAFLWDKCPEGYRNRYVQALCETDSYEDISTLIPVYSNNLNFLFKNFFCATCNGFPKDQIKFPTKEEMHVECALSFKQQPEFQNELPRFIQSKLCNVTYEVSKESLRQCEYNVESTCPPNADPQLIQKCKDSGPWYAVCLQSTQRNFLNPACAKCNIDGCIPVRGNQANTLMGRKWIGKIYSYDILLNYVDQMILEPDTVTTKQPYNSTFNSTFNRTNTNSTIDSDDGPLTRREVMAVITMVCCIISALSLIALIIVYLITKELRNNNGIMVVLLCSWLLLAIITFSIAGVFQSDPKACQAIGILMHFFYLCSFTWMAIYSFDLLRTFYIQAMSSHSESRRRLGIYSGVGLLIPLIITGIALIFNFTPLTPDNGAAYQLNPRYGNPICWFNSKMALVAWFFVPVFAMITFNIVVCLVLFRFFIVSFKQMSQAIQTRQQLFLICIKITTILGVTWVINIIAVFIANPIFREISAIINSLQGFFIMLSFLLSKRIIKTVQTSFSSKSAPSRSSSSRQNNGQRKPLVRKSSSSNSGSRLSTTRSTLV